MDIKINGAIKEYASRIGERYKPRAIYLYGSHAKGTANEYSDVDIAVVVDPMDLESYWSMFGKLFSLAADIDANIEPNLLEDDGNDDKYSFLHEVKATGQKIYG